MGDSPQLGRLLWQLKALGIPTPAREHLFAPAPPEGFTRRRWRFDVCWPDHRLAVELDGSLFTGGRHGGTPSAIRDVEKLNIATMLGWRVLRVVPAQVRSGQAARIVEVAFGVRELDELLYSRQRNQKRRNDVH